MSGQGKSISGKEGKMQKKSNLKPDGASGAQKSCTASAEATFRSRILTVRGEQVLPSFALV